MLGLRFPKPWLIHKSAFLLAQWKTRDAVWSLHIVLILCPSLERWLPGTLPIYFSFLFCLIDNVSRIFTIAQRCRGTQASGNLLERFKFLKLGKKKYGFGVLFSFSFILFESFLYIWYVRLTPFTKSNFLYLFSNYLLFLIAWRKKGVFFFLNPSSAFWVRLLFSFL